MRNRIWTVLAAALMAWTLSVAGAGIASAAPPVDPDTVSENVSDTVSEKPWAGSLAARAAAMRTQLGNDVSWPQCGMTLPRIRAFAIIGVNGGRANNTNPCLAAQLSWAARSTTGGAGQPRVALYVNTANPGHAGSWWPTSNVYGGRWVTNPYGLCRGEEDRACAYMYGYAKASDNVRFRGVENPSRYLWWLDVETMNTWSDDKAANAASLEGMTAYYQGLGARVGLYSTLYQWDLIVGEVGPASNLRGLPSWLAGANGVAGAKGMCSWPALTPGGTVTMTQFVANDLDYNYSCP